MIKTKWGKPHFNRSRSGRHGKPGLPCPPKRSAVGQPRQLALDLEHVRILPAQRP